MRIDFLETDQANELRATLRGLPEGTQIHGIYSRGMKHFAWISTPPDAEKSVSIQNPSATAEAPKARKRKD